VGPGIPPDLSVQAHGVYLPQGAMSILHDLIPDQPPTHIAGPLCLE
jgi:hypothetical protein